MRLLEPKQHPNIYLSLPSVYRLIVDWTRYLDLETILDMPLEISSQTWFGFEWEPDIPNRTIRVFDYSAWSYCCRGVDLDILGATFKRGATLRHRIKAEKLESEWTQLDYVFLHGDLSGRITQLDAREAVVRAFLSN